MMEKRLKWLYAASLALSGLVLGQMLLFVGQHLFKWHARYNIFDLCVILFKNLHIPAPIALNLVNVVILYTLSAVLLLITRQVFQAMKAKKLVAKHQDATLTLQYRGMYQLAEHQLRIISSKAPTAMTIGFRKPQIILSTGLLDMLDPTELHAVIDHEKCHMKHRDPLAIFLLSIMSKALWYIPIFAWLAKKYPIMIELRADKYAIGQMNQPADLGSALLKLLKLQSPAPNLSLSHASFAETSMNVRIKHILDPQMTLLLPWPRLRIAVSLLIVILLMGLI
ncbi:M56 family metallopeptidase [Paenibacillus sp. CGMCC 1.16610]|uniref:M48 family metalloprotease n=1 Tax=Paenibacillus anseongense TaxID=2682845 RepID=A0ABW9U2F4_9BACL|nr:MULTISPECIES: M56 family metallopeptidase [Paenibacillus]MBA2941714.1 M56 family metallopeptidase [Paenibacillus sp. CGMCC 1.16610]MVQ34232.1 M48 family metalloprotease [Paenibacillus anseongense]